MDKRGLLLVFLQAVVTYCAKTHKTKKQTSQATWLTEQTNCPTEDARWITQTFVPWGIPYRAHKTLPPELELRPSTITGAGFGVFSRTFIPKYTWLGEYEGEGRAKKSDSHYLFEIFKGKGTKDRRIVILDALDLALSSWTRWMNTPRNEHDENVFGHQCKGKVLFMTNRDISPGEELMFYYGDTYAYTLGIFYKGWMKDKLDLAKELQEKYDVVFGSDWS